MVSLYLRVQVYNYEVLVSVPVQAKAAASALLLCRPRAACLVSRAGWAPNRKISVLHWATPIGIRRTYVGIVMNPKHYMSVVIVLVYFLGHFWSWEGKEGVRHLRRT